MMKEERLLVGSGVAGNAESTSESLRRPPGVDCIDIYNKLLSVNGTDIAERNEQ